MISASKSEKMLLALKDYKKRYLSKNLSDLDESGFVKRVGRENCEGIEKSKSNK